MSFWEYDAERHLKIEKEDSYNDGFQAGIESEKKNTLRILSGRAGISRHLRSAAGHSLL